MYESDTLWIITSSLLILVAILLRMAFKGKISMRLQYALLAVVLIIALGVVFLDGEPSRLGVTLGLDENTTVEIELAEGSDGRFLLDSFKVATTGRFEKWELNSLENLGFGYSAQDFEALSPDLIKKIFAPGVTPDGAPAFMPDDVQRAELSAHGLPRLKAASSETSGIAMRKCWSCLRKN